MPCQWYVGTIDTCDNNNEKKKTTKRRSASSFRRTTDGPCRTYLCLCDATPRNSLSQKKRCVNHCFEELLLFPHASSRALHWETSLFHAPAISLVVQESGLWTLANGEKAVALLVHFFVAAFSTWHSTFRHFHRPLLGIAECLEQQPHKQ